MLVVTPFKLQINKHLVKFLFLKNVTPFKSHIIGVLNNSFRSKTKTFNVQPNLPFVLEMTFKPPLLLGY